LRETDGLAGLKRAGFEAVLLETRHVKAALSAMTIRVRGAKKARILLRERVNWNGCGVRYIEADQKNSTQ
jgi:hypothetical protein